MLAINGKDVNIIVVVLFRNLLLFTHNYTILVLVHKNN